MKPAHIDPDNGYRYYSGDQLPLVGRILSLRDVGFSLTQIGEILDDEDREGALLERRIVDLSAAIEADQRRLTLARERLAKWQGVSAMSQQVRIESLPEVTVASTRTHVPDYDAFFTVVPKMGAEMRAVGAVCREPAYCFTIFHSREFRDRDLEVEICEAVEASCRETETLKFRQVAGVPEAASTTHHGPYSTLRNSYNALYAWLEANGFQATDFPRESYIDGIWNKDDPSEWVTDIQVPVRRVD